MVGTHAGRTICRQRAGDGGRGQIEQADIACCGRHHPILIIGIDQGTANINILLPHLDIGRIIAIFADGAGAAAAIGEEGAVGRDGRNRDIVIFHDHTFVLFSGGRHIVRRLCCGDHGRRADIGAITLEGATGITELRHPVVFQHCAAEEVFAAQLRFGARTAVTIDAVPGTRGVGQDVPAGEKRADGAGGGDYLVFIERWIPPSASGDGGVLQVVNRQDGRGWLFHYGCHRAAYGARKPVRSPDAVIAVDQRGIGVGGGDLHRACHRGAIGERSHAPTHDVARGSAAVRNRSHGDAQRQTIGDDYARSQRTGLVCGDEGVGEYVADVHGGRCRFGDGEAWPSCYHDIGLYPGHHLWIGVFAAEANHRHLCRAGVAGHINGSISIHKYRYWATTIINIECPVGSAWRGRCRSPRRCACDLNQQPLCWVNAARCRWRWVGHCAGAQVDHALNRVYFQEPVEEL
ncbi:MAG: hypothetical protein BWY63_01723 [Chloroflexi bacterium ADurb.Bin360]|nr:MAG: hypothetical protein BWY63_01723 [Chloroflexi bacterium ADurb.Bin360]